MNFWDNALPIMDGKNIKRSDLARATGKTKSAVTDWIKRGVYPAADDAVKIAERLDVSVKFLVTGIKDSLEPREKELLRICSILNDEKFKAVLEVAQIMRKDVEAELSGSSSSAGSGKGAGNEK